jgi:SNF2 family DNA or RNA helicase
MEEPERTKALSDFRNDPATTIFLLSMRAGTVGLNLGEANHVILMEPCMNKQLEYQAVGRVHRLGQRREVKVY